MPTQILGHSPSPRRRQGGQGLRGRSAVVVRRLASWRPYREPSAHRLKTARRPAGAGLLCERVRGSRYAPTSSRVLCTRTSPPVIFGELGSAVSSFSSRTQLDATRVDSSACAEVSKKPTELMTPLPAS